MMKPCHLSRLLMPRSEYSVTTDFVVSGQRHMAAGVY